VRTGEPAADRVFGMPVFQYIAAHPEFSALFNDAMTAFSAYTMPAVLEAYDFGDIEVLVDVAGGHGFVLSSVLQRYPAMRGILFDVDHVLAGAPPLIARMGVSDRCRTVAGDFFQGVPAGGSAYVMKHIIHDWDDERAGVLLRNVRTALGGRPGGRLILLEAVIAPGNQPDLAKVVDLEMLAMPGGRERTADEFRALFDASGFELTRIVPTSAPLSVVEGRPR
jgi:hypothetical protein